MNSLEKYDRSLAGRVIGRELIFFRRATNGGWMRLSLRLRAVSVMFCQ